MRTNSAVSPPAIVFLYSRLVAGSVPFRDSRPKRETFPSTMRRTKSEALTAPYHSIIA